MRKKSKSRKNSKRRKSVLRLPDLEHAKSAVLSSLTNADAQRGSAAVAGESVYRLRVTHERGRRVAFRLGKEGGTLLGQFSYLFARMRS